MIPQFSEIVMPKFLEKKKKKNSALIMYFWILGLINLKNRFHK